MPLQVELVSPEAVGYTGEADMVIARTRGGGDIAFLPGHVPFIGSLEVWEVKILLSDGSEKVVAVHSGFVEVSNSKVTVLSDLSEMAEEIDVARARKALAAAEAALAADAEDKEAAAAKTRAEVRLRVAGELSSPGLA